MTERYVTVEHGEREHQATCTWCTNEDGQTWTGRKRSGRSGAFDAMMDAAEHIGMIHALDHLAALDRTAESTPVAVIEHQMGALQVQRDKWRKAAHSWRRLAYGMTVAWACLLVPTIYHAFV